MPETLPKLSHYMGYLDSPGDIPTILEGYSPTTYGGLPPATRHHILAPDATAAMQTLQFCLQQLTSSKWRH